MGFFNWVFGKHPVKPARPPHPDKVAEAGRVAAWQGPMVITLLADRGIRASWAESSLAHGARQPLMSWPQAVIYVMEPDQKRASDFIASFLAAEDTEPSDEDGDEDETLLGDDWRR